MKAAEIKQESPPFGDDMMQFFKAPFSIYLNRNFILFLKEKAEQVIKEMQQKSDILDQVVLFSLLHFLKASFLSIKCVRMRVLQLLTKEDCLNFKNLVELLTTVKQSEDSKSK